MYPKLYDEQKHLDYQRGKLCCYTGENDIFEEKHTMNFRDNPIQYLWNPKPTYINYKNFECRCLIECSKNGKNGFRVFSKLSLKYSYEDYITEARVAGSSAGSAAYGLFADYINKAPVDIPKLPAFEGINDSIGGFMGDEILIQLGTKHGLISAKDVFEAHNRAKEKMFKEKCEKTCKAKGGNRAWYFSPKE